MGTLTSVAALLMFLSPAAAFAADAGSDISRFDNVHLGTLVPAEIVGGAQVSIAGEILPIVSSVELCRESDVSCSQPYVLADDESTSNGIKFHVPAFVSPGWYRVRIQLDKGLNVYRYSSIQLNVKRAPPAIASLSTKTLYPRNTFNPLYDQLTIFGSAFASPKNNEVNTIRINGVPLVPCTPAPPAGAVCDGNLIVQGNDTAITVTGMPRTVEGPATLDVVVANQISNQVPLLLSGCAPYMPRVSAGGVLAGVVLLLFLLNRRKVTIPEGVVETPSARIPRWKTIFIDFDSNTYSLSRVQLVIWTFVALFGWVYLSVARSFVQGMVTFSDIPDGLPGVLVVSVGTSVAVGGVSAIRGGKSAGPFSPSISDLWSVGGIIAPERFQFFLWTLVGAVGFLVYTVALDPASIQNLPTLPNGFLQLAGISAAGYVGGKLVRKAGPILANVQKTVDTVANTITWTLVGSGLAQNATFALKLASATGFEEKPLLGAVAKADPASPDTDPTLFKKLTVTMSNPPENATVESYAPPSAPPKSSPTPPSVSVSATDSMHKRFFIIVNPDGQRAEWPY
ncbi:hypothetical protein M3A49_01010 [Paraburkholderia sp. CNPSo 3076]|uniref:hypothetical protein n=1 Tax=Paraburkholderia sp. CNPSo 3076 TaxID=2940936 RepID=UPI002256CA95|nr:hypothetical protein [Paraburkholderia sp. CNPSo 3076]MCX5538091.1 hypothetical protein [Paraburkholderia sp. CNPSo 3076]